MTATAVLALIVRNALEPGLKPSFICRSGAEANNAGVHPRTTPRTGDPPGRRDAACPTGGSPAWVMGAWRLIGAALRLKQGLQVMHLMQVMQVMQAMRVLLLILGVATLTPARADDAQDHERARGAVQAGQAMPWPLLRERLQRSHPGQVLALELEREDGRWVYEVKLLQADGQLLKLELDALSGRVLEMRRQERRSPGASAAPASPIPSGAVRAATAPSPSAPSAPSTQPVP